tara:strand:- start:25 stop:936 length:912 start_codon:yes stop_codon:yes gene_type:complete
MATKNIVPNDNGEGGIGVTGKRWNTAFINTITGNLTGNVTGNVSGTAATVTGAAQSNITSLGTLTTLTVDNVIINGATIGHTSDTDLLTLADQSLTVAGTVTSNGALKTGTGTATANSLGDDFVIDPGVASVGMSIISTNASDTSTGLSFIALGDSANTAISSVSYDHSDNSFSIISNNGSALSINSSRVVSGDLNDTSDVALKKDIVSLGDSIEIMKQLNPVSFYWKDSVKDNTKNIGFVAQEVETILPEVVFGENYSVNEYGHVSAKSVNTTGILALLTKAVQEQQVIIEDLKSRIETLEG